MGNRHWHFCSRPKSNMWPTLTKVGQSRCEDHEIPGGMIRLGSFYQFLIFDFFHIAGRQFYHLWPYLPKWVAWILSEISNFLQHWFLIKMMQTVSKSVQWFWKYDNVNSPTPKSVILRNSQIRVSSYSCYWRFACFKHLRMLGDILESPTITPPGMRWIQRT